MTTFKLDNEDCRELAKYLIDRWDYSDEDWEDLESEIECQINRYSNGKSLKWTSTPSRTAEAILNAICSASDEDRYINLERKDDY